MNKLKLLLMLPLSLWAMLTHAEGNLKDSPFSASLECKRPKTDLVI